MNKVTKRMAVELANHEACVLESYLDSCKPPVWTWGIGVTTASGHSVERYKNNPQPITYCLDVFKWLLETQYAKDVNEVFKGYQLTEEQFAGAVSFHYNTGAIKKASWVESFKKGDMTLARKQFMSYNKPKSIVERRTKEAELIFEGKWAYPNITTIPVYTQVNPKTKRPVWASRKNIDISDYLKEFTPEAKKVQGNKVVPPKFDLVGALNSLFKRSK